MTLLVAAVLGWFAIAGQTDTTIAVHPGSRLEVSNFGGVVAVSSWDRNAVKIEADHGTRTEVQIEMVEKGLRIATSGRRGPPGTVEFHITVPAWMSVVVTGPFSDVSVAGTRSDIKVETVKGDVNVEGGSGFITLSTVQGLVNLARARGRIRLSSVNDGVTASDVGGQLRVETVNGDVMLERVDADAVDASSVSGNLVFSGPLRKAGHYRLQTHSGDIRMLLAEQPNADVAIETFSGAFDSDYKVHLDDLQGNKRFEFTLGSGGPQLDLEAFSGSIQLLRASRALQREGRRIEQLQERMKLNETKLKELRQKERDLREKRVEKAQSKDSKDPDEED
jgi:DUF4097 and DUF4098 domain-containing protein YvlB